MIVPNTMLTNDYCEEIRKFFLNKAKILVLSNEGQVFEGAVVEGLVFVYSKDKNSKYKVYTRIDSLAHHLDQEIFKSFYRSRFLIHLTESSIKILDRFSQKTKKLCDICEVWRGLTTGNDKKFLSQKKLSKSYKKIVQGKQIHRYYLEDVDLFVNYDPLQLDRARPARIFEVEEKLISKFVGQDLEFSYDNQNLYVINTGCVIFRLSDTNENINFILGILNSKLMNFYFKQSFTDYREIFPIVKSGHLEQLPVRTIDFNNTAEKQMHDELVVLVEKMLELHKQLNKVSFASEQEPIQRQIAATDKKIDELVYKLYGLTEEEIKIVEAKT